MKELSIEGNMKYKVGDKVKVREWDDMEVDFGVDKNGYINTPVFRFTKFMKNYCGKIATIVNVVSNDPGCDDNYYNIKTDSLDSIDLYSDQFCFTDKMLELESKNDEDSPIFVGIDIYNFVKEFSKKNINCSDSMTDKERSVYEFGKGQILSLLNQVLNEFFKEDNYVTPTYIVHVPGLNTATDFESIEEIQEQFGGKDL